MSRESAFDAGFSSIRDRTRDAIAFAILSCDAVFESQAKALLRAFTEHTSLDSTGGRAMRAFLASELNACAVALSTRTIECMQAVVSVCASEMDDAHSHAATDAGVEIPDLSDRFDSMTELAFGRIGIAFGRSVSLPELIAGYQASAMTAATALITAGIAHGLSETSIAGDLGALLRGNDIMYGDYGLSRNTMTPLRAMEGYGHRIVLAEGFNTMREATIEALENGQFVEAAKWTLSAAHSVEDVCDQLANAETDRGRGYYAIANWPNAPHPRCACLPGGPLVFFPVAQWT